MDQSKTDTSLTNDVLHIPSQSKLSAEAIAKAIAHHNKQHGGAGQPKAATAKPGSGKKSGATKSK